MVFNKLLITTLLDGMILDVMIHYKFENSNLIENLSFVTIHLKCFHIYLE